MKSKTIYEEELSEYELLRLRNVEENQRMLRSLGLISDEPLPIPRKKKEEGKKRFSRSPVPPTRPKSQRIQEKKEKQLSDVYDYTVFCKPRGRSRKSVNNLSKAGSEEPAIDLDIMGDSENDKKKNAQLFPRKYTVQSNSNNMKLFLSRKAVVSGLLTVFVAMYFFRNHNECCKISSAITILIGIIATSVVHFINAILWSKQAGIKKI